MLQVIISPAKQMRVAQDAFEVLGIPPFVRETARLHRALLDIERNEGDSGLQALWNVSDKLLGPCLNTLHEFEPILKNGDLDNPALARHLSPAVMSYHGIQYQSMAPEVMDSAQLAWLQDHLWILSGLYGCVRPFHAVEPYRLEMGAKLAVDDARDLYAFWGDKLARAIAPAGSNTTIVNLANVEYAKPFCPTSRATPRPSHASLARASATGSPSNGRPPAKRRAAPWCGGWQKTSSRMQANLPHSTSAIGTSPSFQTKTPWFS